MNSSSPKEARFDVVIIGGALSGAATAILLLREQPQLRVLIVERSSVFQRRVGEATVEVSGYFLCRVLGLTQYLNQAHLIKQGMRFWFFNSHSQSLADCSEIGGKYLSRIPAFQLDRAALDEEVLRRAVGCGAELWRPATVKEVQLDSGGVQSLEIQNGGNAETVTARWVVDASGVAALLARQNGWLRANEEHPTTAVWARWTGVKDWDGIELAKKFPEWAMACNGMRATATNHLVGPGWWAWCVPLRGGDVSVGLVFDQRLVEWPEGGPLGQRLKEFLIRHPVGREILSDAQWRDGDVHWRKSLPYCTSTFCGDGFTLVGDAAAFLDPFYSPGLDWVSFSTWGASQLILAQRRGEDIGALVVKQNAAFSRSYERWFKALYQDKYEYLGDFELMRLAFQLDLGLYYLGVASQPFKRGEQAFSEPLFSTQRSAPFYHFMRFYNRRFAAIARTRQRRQNWGRHNHGRRYLMPGFTFSARSSFPLVKALLGWLRLEVAEGWRSWFGSNEVEKALQPAPVGVQPSR